MYRIHTQYTYNIYNKYKYKLFVVLHDNTVGVNTQQSSPLWSVLDPRDLVARVNACSFQC